MEKTFVTTISGLGPFCVEFADGEVITTHSKQRQAWIAGMEDLIAAAQVAYNYLNKIPATFENGKISGTLGHALAAIDSAITEQSA